MEHNLFHKKRRGTTCGLHFLMLAMCILMIEKQHCNKIKISVVGGEVNFELIFASPYDMISFMLFVFLGFNILA